MKAEDLYRKEFGEADSVPKESVIRLLRHFAKVLEMEREQVKNCATPDAGQSLPTDSDVEKWFDENIGVNSDCSASSAIYKFRLWLKERSGGKKELTERIKDKFNQGYLYQTRENAIKFQSWPGPPASLSLTDHLEGLRDEIIDFIEKEK